MKITKLCKAFNKFIINLVLRRCSNWILNNMQGKKAKSLNRRIEMAVPRVVEIKVLVLPKI